MQEWRADLMLGESLGPCTALLAHKLNVSWVNFWPVDFTEPVMSAAWKGSNRQLHTPNPISYFPQMFMPTTTQLMVNHLFSSTLLQAK